MNNNENLNIEPITGAASVNYRNFHLWMLIPFVISVLGFSYSYYFNLSNATFHQHVHGISATLWYFLVILQPYLIIRKKKIQSHRTLGTIGFILAGIVAGSAFTIIPKNIDNVKDLDIHGAFNPTIAYFFTFIDFFLISLFTISVCFAVLSIKQKNLSGHVQWLMASVFFVLSPGLARLLTIGIMIINKGNPEGILMDNLALISFIFMIVLITIFYYKYGSFRHLSFTLLIICHLPFLFLEQIGNNEFIRTVLTAIFK